MQNSISSPEKFVLGDSFESVLGKDSNICHNANRSVLDTKIIRSLMPNISNPEINEFIKTSMNKNNEYFCMLSCDNITKVCSEITKVDNKASYLSIFDCEEPFIKEDLESESSSCTDNKLEFHLRDDMVIAEEVVVTTQYCDKLEFNQSTCQFDFISPDCLAKPKEDLNSEKSMIVSSPLKGSSVMDSAYDCNMIYDNDISYTSNSIISSTVPKTKATPELDLDISTAMSTSIQLFFEDLADTPDILKPVLVPDLRFDLLNYLLNNNCDSNNINTISSELHPKPSTQKTQQRRGKSQLSLVKLKDSQKRSCEAQTERMTALAIASSSSKRSSRASKFKKKTQAGLLNRKNLDFDSTDDNFVPKFKKRKTSLLYKKKNYDLSCSINCESALKYRERRDRNNISSKKSRQKRKFQKEKKDMELKVLEAENQKLRSRKEEFQVALQKILEYLKK